MLALTAFVVPSVQDAVGGRLDWGGAIGLSAGLILVLTAITKGNDWGWSSATTLGMLAAGVVVFALWGHYELGHRNPLVDLRTSARPAVLFCNIAGVAIGFGMMAQSIVAAAARITQDHRIRPGPDDPASRFVDGARRPDDDGVRARLGHADQPDRPQVHADARCNGPRYRLPVRRFRDGLDLAADAGVDGVRAGVGIGYAAMPTLILGSVLLSEAGAAVGLNSLMRSVGTTSASAVMALVLTSSSIDVGGVSFPADSTFTWCFLIGAIAAFIGVAITALVPRTKPVAITPQAPAESTVAGA